jgi:hypothetical protein
MFKIFQKQKFLGSSTVKFDVLLQTKLSTFKMEATLSSETMVYYHNTEDLGLKTSQP